MSALSRAQLWLHRRLVKVHREQLLGLSSRRPRVDPGLPLTLSCNRHADRPFIIEHGNAFMILVDGDPQRMVVAYDVPRGVVERYVLDERGRVVVNRRVDPPVAETCLVAGRVEVRWRNPKGGGA